MMLFVVFQALLISVNDNAEHIHHLINQSESDIANQVTAGGVISLPLVQRNKLASSHGRRRLADLSVDADYGDGSYFVTLRVGNPSTDQTLLMDTGTDLIWIQCQGCHPCFDQPHQSYDPEKSKSRVWVPCDHYTCAGYLSENKLGCSSENGCMYNFSYGTYSTVGRLFREILIINGTNIHKVPMGCSTTTTAGFSNLTDGILGLGWGSLSLASQSSGQIGNAFTFCLGSNQSDGWVRFGRSGFPGDWAKWALLIRNDEYPSFYYVELIGIEVEGTKIDIPGDLDPFAIDNVTGTGGAIIDTGTTVTQLPEVAYNALRANVEGYLLHSPFYLVPVENYTFETCYTSTETWSGPVTTTIVGMPKVSFILSEIGMPKKIIQINASNVLVMVHDPDYNITLTCFAFAKSQTGLSRIGTLQLQGIQITIDASAEVVGFGPQGAC